MTRSPAPSPFAPAAVPGNVTWELTDTPSGSGILRLEGHLKPGWLGRLSAYLTSQSINLVGGTAKKSSAIRWEAWFELEARRPGANPLAGFDPLPALLADEAHTAPPAIAISDLKLEQVASHGGSLYVQITGADCIGFLYGVLRLFSYYSLFPVELELATRGTVVHDRFWLKGIGAATPTREDLGTLRARLEQMRTNGG